MFPKHFSPAQTHPRRSSALIITLAIIVLISGTVLAFFSLGTINRQISFSSAGQYRADCVARTAMDTITGDLRTEIVAGSQVTTINGTNIYVPNVTTPIANLTVLPCRVGDQGFASLIKESMGTSNFWAGANYNSGMIAPIRSAANNNSQTPSLNGRYIKMDRWNQAGLLADPGSGSTPTIPSTYVPPDWIVVTKQGAISNALAMPAMASLSDKTSTNCAVGRFAYTIYDEGGLVDVNVAGLPSTLSGTTFNTERGLLPQVDLANIPGVLNANALVQWRNQTTAASAATYTNTVQAMTNGFMAVSPGDQAFISRRDLIHYAQDNSDNLTTAALPNLTTFTRDTDAPGFFPDAAHLNTTNPNVSTIRALSSFPRADKTQAVPGEPLLKHRFPLSRLALLQNPTASNASLILKYFAMSSRSDGMWDYVDPDDSSHTAMTTLPTIKTLAQVASAGREPTFWELLQAGILTGSLGANNGALNGFTTSQDASTTRQILAIGLSIIDQYDTDDTPTVLNLGGTAPANLNNLFVAGVENLPYISWICQEHFQDDTTSTTPNVLIDGYLFFAMWNPHRNAASAVPGTFRLRFNGVTEISVHNAAPPATQKVSAALTQNNAVLTFQTTTTRNFSQISGLIPSDAILGSTTDIAQFPYPPTGATPAEVGILLGQVSFPATPAFPASGNNFHNIFNTPLTIILEKKVGTGGSANWIPYQILPNFQVSLANDGSNFYSVSTQLSTSGGFTNNKNAGLIAMAHSDPRTSRLGLGAIASGVPQLMLQNKFNLIANATGIPYLFDPATTTTLPGGTGTIGLADYAYNTSATTHYIDPDGVIRKGDANPAVTSTHSVNSPFYITSSDARPLMLNRPFTSVAEMGYVFRDDPWRSLNFASQDSADGGLLDLFCLNENDNPLRAGVLNMNTASLNVLTAILMNAYQDPSSTSTTPLTSANATTIAQAIRTQLGPVDNPLLVIKSAADLPLLADKVAASLPSTFKFEREAFTRSFADIANGRTWDLMIDVIAQSGRYGPTAKTLNDFTVEGERRYWMHVAIDRFTGVILDSQIEPVEN